jgi:hypothetical protein
MDGDGEVGVAGSVDADVAADLAALSALTDQILSRDRASVSKDGLLAMARCVDRQSTRLGLSLPAADVG